MDFFFLIYGIEKIGSKDLISFCFFCVPIMHFHSVNSISVLLLTVPLQGRYYSIDVDAKTQGG